MAMVKAGMVRDKLLKNNTLWNSEDPRAAIAFQVIAHTAGNIGRHGHRLAEEPDEKISFELDLGAEDDEHSFVMRSHQVGG